MPNTPANPKDDDVKYKENEGGTFNKYVYLNNQG
jgi:hypothetical protein